MSEVVRVEHLYKKFCKNLKSGMGYGFLDLTTRLFGINSKSNFLRKNEFWALDDINFTVNKKEILGIIGANGAGKSTLLRVLNGIYPPDAGCISIDGRIGGLIALGAGFHPHMTGHENIFLNGVILGMTKDQIKNNYDKIVDFADIGDFIHSPVSTYSSGMYARLGFAIAIHAPIDILLIDEVLSVGDYSFQNKCLRKIAEIRDNAKSVIFIGHNMDMIEAICDRAILLYEGKINSIGKPLEVIACYRALARNKEYRSEVRELQDLERKEFIGDKNIIFIKAGILDNNNNPCKDIKYGDDINIFYEFKTRSKILKPQFGVGFSHPSVYPWNIAYDSNISNKLVNISSLDKDKLYRLIVKFKKPNLIPGVYRLNLMIRSGYDLELYHHLDHTEDTEFNIKPKEVGVFIFDGERPTYNSLIFLESEWAINKI
jgi:lipopolysaccharide transport system ATP-binding protein